MSLVTADAVIETARHWLGTPYHHQGSVKGAGTDCLGLIRGIWRELYGQEPETVPAYTKDWAEPQGDEVLWWAARRHLHPRLLPEMTPGDLLLFRMRDRGIAKHLGVPSREGPEARFIHAYSGHGVIESPLSPPWRRRVVAAFAFPEEIV